MDKKAQIILFFFVILLDQLSKLLVFSFKEHNLNSGISFGLASDINNYWWLLFLSIFLIFLLKVVTYYKAWHWSLVIFLGAAVSNLIDRFFWGGVRDFLAVPYFNLTNNLADYLIIGSLTIYIYVQIFSHHLSRS